MATSGKGRPLENDEQFPSIEGSSVAHGEISVREYTAGSWSVPIFYRGHWCPYCNRQLADFQLRLGRLKQLGAKMIALSAQPKDKAELMIQRHGLTYPIVYGLDPDEMTRKIGCSISLEKPIRLEPVGIVLRPDGTIAWSVYASGAIGRLTGDDTSAVMDYYQQNGW